MPVTGKSLGNTGPPPRAGQKSKTAVFSLCQPQMDEAMNVWLAKGRKGAQGKLPWSKGTKS